MDFTQAWSWPQWTWVIVVVLGLIIDAAEHGKPKGEYNFPMGLIGKVIAAFILICGGFFSPS